MLPDRDTQLLTAYVDGELSGRQRKTVARLLQKSPEARALLDQLQADADRVQRLPHRKLNGNFSHQVLDTIARRGLRPTGLPGSAARRPGWTAWTRWAVAAVILLSVGTVSYLAFPPPASPHRHSRALVESNKDRREHKKAGKQDKQSGQPENNVRQVTPGSRDGSALAKNPKKNDASESFVFVGPPEPRKKPRDKTTVVKGPKKGTKLPVKGPGPKSEENPVLASGSFVVDPDPPVGAMADVSVMMLLSELNKQENKDRLATKLHKDNAYHVQMLCRDSGVALGRLRGLLEAQGIQLVIDQKAQARLKNPRLRTNYALYAENLTPAELTAILDKLGEQDREAAKKQTPEQFGYLVVNTMSAKFKQQITRFLGAPPRKASGKGKGPLGVDIRKPVAAGTASQVTRTLKAKAVERSQVKPAAGKGRPRQVLVLAYNADNSPVHPRVSTSKEVKLFRAGRTERLAGTIQVVLVLRRDSV